MTSIEITLTAGVVVSLLWAAVACIAALYACREMVRARSDIVSVAEANVEIAKVNQRVTDTALKVANLMVTDEMDDERKEE